MQPLSGNQAKGDESRDELRSQHGFVYSRYGLTYERIRVYDVSDYLNNEAMIKQLHEEKEMALEALHRQRDEFEVAKRRHRDEITQMRSSNRDIELDNQKFKYRLGEIARISSTMFVLQIAALLLLGIGINVLTGNPVGTPWFWLGCALVVLGVAMEVVAFLLKPREGVVDGQN